MQEKYPTDIKLTKPVEQISPSEAAISSTSQELSHILCNTNVHYLVHNSQIRP
jgi:hypothetical protein